MMMIRQGERETYHHHFGRLFQQFLVDNYVRIEKARLQFITTHQEDIRAEVYSGLVDNANSRQIGRSVILPSSFTGGPRYMKQMLQDGLAIVRTSKRNSYFIYYVYLQPILARNSS